MPARRPRRAALLLLLLAAAPLPAQQRWTLTPELRIGSVDDPATALTNIGDILVGDDGVMYVTQPQQKQIRLYSAEGELLRIIGGEGAGPGEFRAVSDLFWRGDTLQVLDFAQQRFTLFTREGDLVRTYRPLPRGAVVMHLVSAEFPDGSVYARVRGNRSGPSPLLRITGDGPPDTLAWVNTAASFFRARVGEAIFSAIHPLPGGDRTSLDLRGRTVTVVEQPPPSSTDSALFRVRRISYRGEPQLDRWFRYAPRPVTREEADRAVASLREGMSSARDWTPVGLARHFRSDAIEEALREQLQLPTYHAPVLELLVGRDGTTWLQLSAPDPTRNQWMILDTDGEVLARLTVPSSLRILAAERHRVWGVEADELDVPYLVRHRIAPR